MSFDRLIFCLGVFFVWNGQALHAERRIAVVDLEANGLAADEKRGLLNLIREQVARYKIWLPIPESEIESHLVENTSLRDESLRLEQSHEQAHEKIKEILLQAQAFYRESDFEKSLQALDSARSLLSAAALKISEATLRDYYELKGAVLALMGDSQEAESLFAEWRTLQPSASLSASSYPPVVAEAFERASSVTVPVKVWNFRSTQQEFKISLLGIEQKVTKEGDLFRSEVPDLGSGFQVVLVKENFRPEILSLEALPSEILWKSLEVKRKSTKGLFAPVGQLSPHPELKWYITHMKAFVVFLGALQRKDDQYFMSGQWYEGSSGNLSVVREVRDPQLSVAVDRLMDMMAQDISATGSVLDSRQGRLDPELSALAPHPFYKTWWFWTLSSVALAGAGVGTYFLLNQKDEFKFQVVSP